MRTILLATTCIAVLGLSAYLSARPNEDNVKVRLRLLDAQTGKGMGGMVRIVRKGEVKPLVLAGLCDRLRGLERSQTRAGWYVVPASGAEITLPRAPLHLEAVSGLETALTRQEIDPRTEASAEQNVRLRYLFRPDQQSLVAGNTHLHLRAMSLEDANDYLRQIPAADGLKVLFISYLERFRDDQHYITNRYPIGDLKQFDATGVLLNNGEEHRHNFQGFGQGYGHVMLLDLQRLVQPVSLGPGITGSGTDDRPLRPGIDDARRQGGTIIWCHNTNGHEDVPSALTGRLDALNVFDGSRTGTYEENYYRYLNIGLRLPISTGTDWFLYDFARVFAAVPGKLTIKSWLEAVKAGRCLVTNGPLLTLTVDGQPVGSTLTFEKPRNARVEVTGLGRHDFGHLQLIHNGQVIHREAAQREGEAYRAGLVRDVKIDRPGWLAARIETPTKNELDCQLYAHTSPVYLDVAGERIFDLESARGLLRQMEEAQADIRARGQFSSPQATDKLLGLYAEAVGELTRRMNQRGK